MSWQIQGTCPTPSSINIGASGPPECQELWIRDRVREHFLYQPDQPKASKGKSSPHNQVPPGQRVPQNQSSQPELRLYSSIKQVAQGGQSPSLSSEQFNLTSSSYPLLKPGESLLLPTWADI